MIARRRFLSMLGLTAAAPLALTAAPALGRARVSLALASVSARWQAHSDFVSAAQVRARELACNTDFARLAIERVNAATQGVGLVDVPLYAHGKSRSEQGGASA